MPMASQGTAPSTVAARTNFVRFVLCVHFGDIILGTVACADGPSADVPFGSDFMKVGLYGTVPVQAHKLLHEKCEPFVMSKCK